MVKQVCWKVFNLLEPRHFFGLIAFFAKIFSTQHFLPKCIWTQDFYTSESSFNTWEIALGRHISSVCLKLGMVTTCLFSGPVGFGRALPLIPQPPNLTLGWSPNDKLQGEAPTPLMGLWAVDQSGFFTHFYQPIAGFFVPHPFARGGGLKTGKWEVRPYAGEQTKYLPES